MPAVFRKLALVATLLSSAAFAADADLAISGANVRAVPPGTPNSVAYMTISNAGATDRKLVKADSPVARVVELHTHTSDNGVMKMRQVQDVPIKANDQTELKPGGYHIMLIDLRQTPREGDTVPVTLTFDDGSTRTVNAPVTKPQAMPMAMDHGKMKH
jgi:copper(I)-binding protein